MLTSQNECFKLLNDAQLTLGKTKGKPENDLRNARNNATTIENQNKLNKDLLNYIDKYDLASIFRFQTIVCIII